MRVVQSKITNQESVLRSLVKRKRHNLCRQQLSSHIDLNSLTGVCKIDGHVSHADVLFEKWRGTPGSNVASALSIDQYIMAISVDSAISYFKAHELTFDARFLLFCQSLATDEISFIQLS